MEKHNVCFMVVGFMAIPPLLTNAEAYSPVFRTTYLLVQLLALALGIWLDVMSKKDY